MTAIDKPNPFHVLCLPTDAVNDDIVGEGQVLSDLAADDDERLLIRWALEQLLTHPLTRLGYEIFEVPGAQYHDEAWEALVRKNRRNPVDLTAMRRGAEPPGPGDFNLTALLDLSLDGLLTTPPVDVRAAIDEPPVPPGHGAPPLEVAHVVFG